MMAEGKVRKWAFWLLTLAFVSRFYRVQELLAAYAFFAIAFAAVTFVVLSLYLLQKGWEVAAVRLIDSERRMARGMRAGIWPAGPAVGRSKSAQELKTESRNSKDWNDKGSLNWADREERAERT